MLNPTQVIEKCAQTSSTTEKVKILQENETDLLKKCLNYCLDPYKVYGIKKFEFLPTEHPYPVDHWDIIFIDICDNLINRQYTGDNARNQIKQYSKMLSSEKQRMLRWILEKDFKAGLAEGLVNKAFHKLIPEFEVQLAQPPKFLKKVIYPCLVQPKLDGVRTIALVDPKEESVVYYSRNGKEFKNFTCFNKELLMLTNKEPKMFDGEVIGSTKGNEFLGIMQQVRRKYDVEPKGLDFHVFDWMPLHHFSRQYATLKQEERTDYLDELEGTLLKYQDKRRVWIVNGKVCNNEAEVMQFYDTCINEEGFEGVIIKDLKGEYDFKRSTVWVKMKPSETAELKVIEVQEGTGKYKGKLGALVVEREGVKINVGSGFDDNERLELDLANQWFIGKTIEIEYDSITPDGSFRFPRFKCIRDDK